MLMVIFGAGASYDSLAVPPQDGRVRLYRPPLANELFGWRFGEDIDRFPQCKPVIPYLQMPGVNVESELEKLQNEAAEHPARYKQLAAIRYYLQTMLWGCQLRWGQITRGVTNYKTLLDQIAHRRGSREKVCLVTFNYDTLLEEALPTVGLNLASIADYIKSDYQVIKLHGSINWARNVKTYVGDLKHRSQSNVASELIDRAAELQVGQDCRVIGEYPIGRSDQPPMLPLFPALAIPVETKPEYECPPVHLRVLETCLPKVTKALVIGWRAAEKRFLKSLANGMRKDTTRMMVVWSNEERAIEIIRKMREVGVSAQSFVAGKGGFSQAILNREIDNFLKS